ncbi:MAG: heparinase, partial [Deltaproteobacteria bacterium]|nr:heparinase [Deltaproteobacteria bacterium]
MSLSLYLHTVRHLRPCQVYGRVFRLLPRPLPPALPALRRRENRGEWVLPARREPSMTGPSRFRILNVERNIDGRDDWNAPEIPKLWLYHLHYFDDLNARGNRERKAWHEPWIARWIRENPPPRGNGWEPYPTSLRIVNWIKWALGGGALSGEAARSLAAQAGYLERRLETHLLGNHLFANAKALAFAGLFFKGDAPDRWLKKGMKILRGEVREQVLPDGGHFERSPMYHGIILEDLLDLVNLVRSFGAEAGGECGGSAEGWEETAARMLSWLRVMCHPDGEIALLNDAAFGIAPRPSELEAYARRLGVQPAAVPRDGATSLAESGYVRIQEADAVLLLDVGPLGPDYLPAHGHADTLTFELSLHGGRVIVDSGTSVYDVGPDRRYQRGTSAHNTVVVDGLDSSEVWGSFRVARRAKPFGLRIDEREGEISVECAHDGYLRLPGRVVHRRTWTVSPGRLSVEDVLAGGFRAARWSVLLHPEAVERPEETRREGPPARSGGWRLPGGPAVRWRVAEGDARYEDARYHPEFGVSKGTVR